MTARRSLSSGLIKFGRRSFGEHVAFTSILFLIALGIVLRARGVLDRTLPLWLDEATWAVMLIEQPLGEHLIRPIGFMAVIKAIVATVSASETSLRALPFAAGVASPILAALLARRLFQSWAARFVLVGIVSLHPGAIDLAKEFKPYSVSLAFHLAIALGAVRYARGERGRDLAVALALAALGVLFAQDVIFAYPGVFLVLGYFAWKERRRRHLIAIAATAFGLVLTILAMYVFIWRHLGSSETEYWANKYHVFFTGEGGQSRLAWTLEQYQEMTSLPGVRREKWEADWLSRRGLLVAQRLDFAIWFVLHGLGALVLLWQRRLVHALLLVLPLAVMTLFNQLGFWPFGVFRTNLFVLVYFAAIAAAAFDERPARPLRLASFAPVLVLVLLPLLGLERRFHESKLWFTSMSSMPKALGRVVQLPVGDPEKPTPVVLDYWSCDLWRYYVDYHPRLSVKYAELRARFTRRCEDDGELAKRVVLGSSGEPGQQAVLIYSKASAYKDAQRTWLRQARVSRRTQIGLHTILIAAPKR